MKITNNFRFDELCFILFAFFKNNASDDNNQIVTLIENDLILLAEYTGIPSAVNNVNFEVKRVINLFTTFNSNSNSNSDTEVGIEDDLELVIFKKFSGSLVELENFIYSVKAFINLQICSLNLETFKASEGQGSTYKHFARERDARIVKAKKIRFLIENKALFCEACGFNFEAMYGSRGTNYVEVHHKIPLSEVIYETITRLDDLCLLCSNCHKIVHRKEPWITLEGLKEIISDGVAA